MTTFSPSDAALTGFRIVREHPRAAAIWAVIQFIVSLGSSLVMVSLAGPALASLSAGGATPRDPAATLAMVRQLVPFYLFLVVFLLAFYPIVYAAMNRAVFRPQDEGFGYIRLGADELRQLGLMLLMIGVGVAAYIALIIAVVVVAVPVGMMTGVRSGGGAGNVGANVALGALLVLLVLGMMGGWIYVWVRLSLASALTFATRKVNLFGSWSLTRGQFWPMFGAYVVAFILVLIVLVLTQTINFAVTATAGGGLGAVMRPDLSSPAALLTPARLISLAISAISSALLWPVVLTPPAAIYRSLPGAVNAMDAASTFD